MMKNKRLIQILLRLAVDRLDSQQQVSVSLKFGSASDLPELVKKRDPKNPTPSNKSRNVAVRENNKPDIRFMNSPEEKVKASNRKTHHEE